VNRKICLALFALTIIARLVVSNLTNYAVDDAFITFRYAENIAAGNGMVYNLGEKVLGTTTPLFTLLIALFNYIGIGGMTAAMMINLMAAGLTAVILYRWSTKLGLDKLALLPAIIYIVFPRSVICDICGMETGFFTLLVTAGLYLLYTKRHLASMIIGSLATVTRPEGVALLALAVVVALVRDPKSLLGGLAPILIIVGGWLTFALLYFGSMIPNSLTAKMALYAGNEHAGIWPQVVSTLGLGSMFGWAVWSLFVLGLLFVLRREGMLLLIALWCGAYFGALALSGTHVFFWYTAPVYPVVLMLVTITAHHFWKATLLEQATAQWFPAVAMILVVLSSAAYLTKQLDPLKREVQLYQRVHIGAANYLSQHAGPTDRVLAEDIGYFGYTYRGMIIDRDGLVTPQAAGYNRRGEYARFADSVKADWLFLDPDYPTAAPIITAPDFAERYQPVFPADSTSRSHVLYRRVGN
jgi:hypothetical protein